VTQATVTSVSYGPLHVQGQEVIDGFRVESTLADGTKEVLGAKAVVFAVGPSSRPNIPKVILNALGLSRSNEKGDKEEEVDPSLPWSRAAVQGEAWCHSAAFALKEFKFLTKGVGDKIARGVQTTVVVIGGGCVAFAPASQLEHTA
jgi:hypothetical protein